MTEAIRNNGRPRLFSDPIYFEERVDAYFDECEKKKKVATISGLCYFLGFADKQSLDLYQEYEGFTLTVKRARLRIEASKNEMLFARDYATAGVIFDLKNNHGWTDKTEINDITPREYGREAAKAIKAALAATIPSEDQEAETANS